MGHKTDLRQVPKTSPRRLPAKEPKPITSRTGPRQRLSKRLVPLQHNLGDPILIVRPPVEFRRELAKAAKKARRQAAAAFFAPSTELIPNEPSALPSAASAPTPLAG